MYSFYFFMRKFIKLPQKVLNFLQKGIYFFQSVHTGFFLGALKQSHLEKIDLRKYNNSKGYYDEGYNKKALFEWEQLAIDTFFKNCKTLLLTAAGAGREAYNLEKQGFELNAYEYNDKLRVYGNKLLENENLTTRIHACERDYCPKSKVKFDGAIVGYGSYTHIKGSEKRISFLKQIHGNIAPNGIVLVSFYVRSYAYMNLRRIKKTANFAARIFKNEPLELGDSLDVEYVHYFTKEEIEKEFNKAGFLLLEYRDGAFGCAVAKKDAVKK